MSFSCRIESVQRLATTAYLVRLEVEAPFSFQAGQHIQLSGADQVPLEGYFSIASPPESPWLELIVRADNRELKPGSLLSAEGPFGSFGLRAAPHRHACLISQGTGIAPMLSILRSRQFSQSAPLSVTLLAGYRDESEVIGLEPFGTPLRSEQYRVTLTRPRDPEWPGLKGRVTDHLKRGTLAIDWGQTEFYLCGSQEMLTDVKAILAAHGVAASSVHSD